MKLINKSAIKEILGQLPLTAEVYGMLRQPGKSLTADFALDELDQNLATWKKQAAAAKKNAQPGNKVFIFSMLRYWLEHATLLSLALAGMGHTVTLAYLPYSKWQTPMDRFNLRRQSLYTQGILVQADPLVKIAPLATSPQERQLPPELEKAIQLVALRDTQYTLQVEEVSLDSDLYRLRLDRNMAAARAAYALLRKDRPQVVLLPNGTILEFGALYQVARYLYIPTVTYEFGEQRDRIWLALNAEVMRQSTDELWAERKYSTLSEAQFEQVRQLLEARQHATLWENFARRWQGAPSEGGEKVRAALGLDARPIVLLATNVIGDSLTLGRQAFSDSMTEWLERTVQFFANHPEVQFVVRIHPGELVTKGPSVADVVHRTLPELPSHIHLVPADAKINTYDLVQICDLGLVYTTTVGMEMVMSGVPVIVAGNTHYRGKGFTLDPETWQSYSELLSHVLPDPVKYRPTQQQVEQAWNYAYRFFFEYPHPFPWHLLQMPRDVAAWPIERVLSAEGQARYGNTFRYLVGEPVEW
jgi:hypothetical protein